MGKQKRKKNKARPDTEQTDTQMQLRIKRLLENGNTQKALTLCEKLHDQNPRQPLIIAQLSEIYNLTQDYFRAANLIESHADYQQFPDLCVIYGDACLGIHDKLKARQSYERAIGLDSQNIRAYQRLANLFLETGHIDQAYATYQSALVFEPDNNELLNNAALCAGQLGYQSETITLCRKLVTLNPQDAETHYRLGLSLAAAALYDQAIDSYKSAMKLKPDSAVLHSHLAQAHEKYNQLEDAKNEALLALKYSTDCETALLVLGIVERRQGKFDQAKQHLSRLTNHAQSTSITIQANTEMGKLSDKCGDYNSAMSYFISANSASKQLAEYSAIDGKSLYKQIKDYQNFLPADKSKRLNQIPHDQLASPIFLVGFPRSGTTLTEQILSSHPNLESAGEHGVISHLIYDIENIIGRPLTVPSQLDQLTPTEIGELRQCYWSNISHITGHQVLQKRYIDKMPINIVHLGFIGYLFPESPILVAIRDPRDVCLSSFMQMFTLNEATVHCLTLQDTVQFYAAVMALWQHYRNLLDINWLEFKYEELTQDFTATSRQILTFLQEQPSEQMRYYYESAKDKLISTPSYEDVIKPLHNNAIGRWRHYQDQLQPFLTKLLPYIDDFGYST